ncbi:MAG: hypothetical protein AB7O70_04030, partial [Hyphomicrobiales bacterium]
MSLKAFSLRLVASVLTATFVLAAFHSITAAGAEARKPFKVVTTFTVIQDIAQNVAGDRAIVESI